MSRIGKQPIKIPQGVKTAINGTVVAVEGPRGKLQYTLGAGVTAATVDGTVVVSATELSNKQIKSNYGTARAVLNSMVLGVTQGWKKSLELNGVGFNAKVQGDALVMTVGYSHEVKMVIPKAIKCNINKNTVELESYDKQVLGDFAANVRKSCPPEPYLGKGIKYSTETIRRKAGKTGKK